MNASAAIDAPEEILLSTQMSAEGIGERAKIETALALVREGRLSSGLAAKWVGESRVNFCCGPRLRVSPCSTMHATTSSAGANCCDIQQHHAGVNLHALAEQSDLIDYAAQMFRTGKRFP